MMQALDIADSTPAPEPTKRSPAGTSTVIIHYQSAMGNNCIRTIIISNIKNTLIVITELVSGCVVVCCIMMY